MDEVKEVVQLDWKTVIVGIVICAAFLKIAVEFITWLIKQFGIEFKNDRDRKEKYDLLIKTIDRIEKLETGQKKVAEDSKKYDNEIKRDVEKLSEAIKNLFDKVNDMADKQAATACADLKDKIAQRYRKYTIDKQWTSMEKESFIGLIRDYEAHGGTNSFVHSVCEPESFTWLVVDDDNINNNIAN